jgi:prepilin-type N-terminal cleavage/methylation domain-containing protein
MKIRSSPEHNNARVTQSSGFTLLEVLIALAILGLCLAFLTGTAFDSFTRVERIDREEHAVVLADNILARLGHDIPVVPGTTSGKEGDLVWHMTIAPLQDQGALQLDQIDLDITTLAGRPIGHWLSLRVAAQAK